MKIFLETQKFNQWWLILILIVIGLVGPVIIISDWQSISEQGSESRIIGIIAIAVELLVVGLILYISLKTRIDEVGVHYMFFPLHWKFRLIPWAEIQNCHVRKYKPILEYGGWGMKLGLMKKHGRSITVKGDMGIQLELKTGKKILIGTQKSDQVERTLATYKHKFEKDEMV